MDELAPAIDLDLANKLRDPQYRRKFFLAESSALIAEQLIALRKRRELSQKQVAELAGTRQPAISRAEQADYQNWSFNTLRSIAEVLDARIRVLIQASEDVLNDYETSPSVHNNNEALHAPQPPTPGGSTAWNDFFPTGKQLGTPMNDDLPHDPGIADQVRRNLVDPREPPAERRIG